MNTSSAIKRKSYHTSLKFLAKRDLLSAEYQAKINRSLLWKWKNEPYEKYFGHELGQDVDSQTELFAEFANNRSAQRIFKAYLWICKLMIVMVSKVKNFNMLLRTNKAFVIEVIEEASQNISLTNILECLNISRSRYYNWYAEVKRKCRRSPLQFCLKTIPQQLTSKEVGIIKQLLLNEEFMCWPIASVAYYAIREKLVAAPLQTWYKYAKLLDIQRIRPKFNKKKKIGIRASSPNEYWHADVTLYELEKGVKVYIYFLMDNFSRRILSWRVSDKLRASIRLDTIREAYDDVTRHGIVNLIVDGGSENNNETVEEFLKGKPLKKLVAQTDISFSNSMIEAVNRIMKHAYLAGKEFYSLPGIKTAISEYVIDFNSKRPHYSLKGLIPDEAYEGIVYKTIDYQAQIAESRVQILSINKLNRCDECL